jgi:hypothetical protein
MTGRIVAASLVMTLLPINLAHAQTAVSASPGKLHESIAREAAKQLDATECNHAARTDALVGRRSSTSSRQLAHS